MNSDQHSTPQAPSGASESDATRIDRVCDQLERAWASGSTPHIRDFLGDEPEPARSRLFEELLQSDLECRVQAGSTIHEDDYLVDFPGRGEQIRAVFRRFLSGRHRTGRAGPGTPADRRMVAAIDSSSGTMCGNYRLEYEVARGGMGIVFKAYDTRLQRTVALKMILDGNLASTEAVQRFYSEAEMAAGLDHPGIVPVYDVGAQEGHHYYAMGYIEGPTLSSQLNQRTYSAREAASLIIELARAVQYAHDHGVVHRDLKPGNILLGEDGSARITDFGLARRTDRPSQLTMAGQILGTPGYMAPEQATGDVQQAGPAVDIYALGAVLYHLLTGHPPFRSTLDALVQMLQQDPIPPRVLNRQVPRDLDRICMKCLSKEPAQRYASAAELAADLQRFLDGEPIRARKASLRQRLLQWARYRPRLATEWVILAAIYVYHLACYFGGNPGSQGTFHQLASGMIVFACCYAWLYQKLLLRPEATIVVVACWIATDIVVFSLFLAAAADGVHSPLVVLYLCMVAASVLSFDRHLVWLVTGASIVAYLVVAIAGPWTPAHLPVPTFRQTAPVAISMLAIGLIQYFALRFANQRQQGRG